MQGLIKLAKAKPGAIKFGTAGAGSPMHMGGEIFKDLTHIDILHVPYSGGGPALVGDRRRGTGYRVRHGRVHTAARAFRQDPRDRHCSVRPGTPEYPNLPTFIESGLPAYEANAWYSMHAPAGTPPEIVRRLNAELVAILKDADVLARFKQLSTDPVGNSPEEFAAFVTRRARQVRAHHQGGGNKARLML